MTGVKEDVRVKWEKRLESIKWPKSHAKERAMVNERFQEIMYRLLEDEGRGSLPIDLVDGLCSLFKMSVRGDVWREKCFFYQAVSAEMLRCLEGMRLPPDISIHQGVSVDRMGSSFREQRRKCDRMLKAFRSYRHAMIDLKKGEKEVSEIFRAFLRGMEGDANEQ